MDLSSLALGAWSGGRFMRFGEPVDDTRLLALLRPDERIPTVLTADAYGEGEADRLVGRALLGLPRDDYVLVGAIGHDFYAGEREGAKGFPRFTDPRLRGPAEYGSYLRMACERALQRCGDDGLARAIGVAPGPANGFTLDLIDCFERHGELIDWAMIILNPFEPWPGELVLDAAAAHEVRTITRVVDYGGLFWDDVRPGHAFAERDHRLFRPAGWIEEGRARLDRLRPIAARHGLTPMQLAVQWNLAHPTVACAVPTLIQEAGPDARPVEDKRAGLAAPPTDPVLDAP